MTKLSIIETVPQYPLIRDYVFSAVERYGENNAFVLKNEKGGKAFYRNISYYAFGEEMRDFGSGLCRLGLKGKRIAVIGFNSYEWILSFLSVLCGVGVCVPLDKELSEEDVIQSLRRAKADAVIFDAKFEDLFTRLTKANDLGISHFVSTKKFSEAIPSIAEIEELGRLYRKDNNDFDKYSPDPDALALLLFTSGTTSSSKAVMLSNRNVATNLFDLLSTEKIYTTDRNLVFLPLHHTFGSVGLTFFLCSGATNMFCDGLRHVQKNLKEYRITTFVCVPLLLEAMYRNIWRTVEKKGLAKMVKGLMNVSEGLMKMKIDVRRKLFSSILKELGGEIRFIISGASAIDKEVSKGFNALGITTVQGYGLTETSPVLSAESVGHIRFGSVGLVFPSVEITIEDPDENGVGEIVAKGGNIMMGYYEMPEETAKVLKDGRFHTGDLGKIDEDGYLYITGRKKNVVVLKSGKNVYPEELEELVAKLPFVSEVMVYGRGNADDLQVAAKIVYNKEYFEEKCPDKTETEIAAEMKDAIARINETLPTHQHIKHLTFQTTPFAKTSTAKVKRFEEIAKENQ